MSYFFDVYGPFGIDRSDGQIKRAGQSMWAQAEAQDPGLSQSWGCYVFCIQNGNNVVPWYVGKTWAEGGFRAEVFGDHKLDLYNWCANWNGQRTMLLFPLMTGGHDDVGQFSSNKSSHSVISWLERSLIARALDRNPDLLNIRDTKLLRSVTVRGVMGLKSKGRPHQEVDYARRALGVSN